MKLVVFGASGQTGRELVKQALDAGHDVAAYVRREGAMVMDHPHLKVVVGSLEDFSKLLEAVTGADVCFSTLGGGSLTKRSAEFTGGIRNILAVMEQAGVKRIIYMSSVGASDSRYYMGPMIRLLVVGMILRVPLADHTANEKLIMASRLSWTLVRPTSLVNGEKTGKVRHGSDFIKLTGNGKVTRADVAAFMLEQAAGKDYIDKAAWLIN